MRSLNACDGECITGADVGRRTDRDRLVAVVDVALLTRACNRGCNRDVEVRTSDERVDGQATAASGSKLTQGVVELVGVETSDLADERSTQGTVGDLVAKRARGFRQVTCHAVVVTRRERETTTKRGHALFVHDRITRSDVVVAGCDGWALDEQRAFERRAGEARHVDVAGQLLRRGFTESLLLQRIAQLGR